MLGPFQGNPACIRIPLCAGVCGAAALQNKVQRVDDVHQFPGHIACDSASNAEIVIPIHKNGKLVGVLDLDSPLKNRFTEEDEAGLKKIVAALEEIAENRGRAGRNRGVYGLNFTFPCPTVLLVL